MESVLPCPILGKCSNCTEMDRPVVQQLLAKQERVERALGRKADRVMASPDSEGYRYRIAMRTDSEGRLGYYRHRSHDHVPVPSCAIAHPLIESCRAVAGPLGFPIHSAEFRTDGTRTIVHLHSAKGRKAKREAVLAWGRNAADGLALDGAHLWGERRLEFEAGGILHSIGHSTFYQVNLPVNRMLVEAVAEQAMRFSPCKVLDLYSGCGNLSLPLAAKGTDVLLVESGSASLADARRTAEREGLSIETRHMDAGRFQAGDAFFDLAILDPPRAGARGVIEQLAITRPKAIVYVSCEPRSLARDLAEAVKHGYAISRLELFDMFPHTRHLETLCVLVRQ
jgi:23S rRNA (uracil1939-C5)-methyltransferase